jgi:hypothetical protein
MSTELEDRIAELEEHTRRIRPATDGQDGWVNFIETRLLQERNYALDVVAHALAQFHRQILDETKALLDTAMAKRIRGTYARTEKYEAGDMVVLDGASFTAKRGAPGQCPGPDWQLTSMRGSRGVAGERGAPGRDAPTIKSWKVDRQRYLVIPVMSDGREGPTLELRALFEPGEAT